MKCRFSEIKNKNEAVRLDNQEILKSESFRYFGLIIHKNWEIENDVNRWIKARWMKCKSTWEVLCDPRISIKLKRKFYKIFIRLTIHKMSKAKMKMHEKIILRMYLDTVYFVKN